MYRTLRVILLNVVLTGLLLSAGPLQAAPSPPAPPRPAACCFHVRLVSEEGAKLLPALLEVLDQRGELKFMPVFDGAGSNVVTVWKEQFRGPSIPFNKLDPWLCVHNPSVCRASGGKGLWSLRRAPKGARPDVVGLNCAEEVPSYVVCLPQLRITPYLETTLRQINRPKENVGAIVVNQLRGCEAWTLKCQQLVRNLNATRPGVSEPKAHYRGEARLPVSALSVEILLDASQDAATQTAVADTLFAAFIRASGLSGRVGTYAVLTDDRAWPSEQRLTPQALASLAEAQDLEDRTEKALAYPYMDNVSRLGRGNLPAVVVGVWDEYVDEQHCAFKTDSAVSVVTVPDAVARARIEASGQFTAMKAPVGSCAAFRTQLDDAVDHGTAVAGVIAAQPMPGWSGGLNPAARLWAADLEDLLRGIEQGTDPILAANSDKPLAVVNISEIGASQSAFRSQFDRVLFGDASGTGSQRQRLVHDVVVVAAAGNATKPDAGSSQFDDRKDCAVYPACFGGARAEGSGFLTVTATGIDGSDLLRCQDVNDLGIRPAVCVGAPPDTVTVNYGESFDVAASGVAVAPVYGNYFAVQAGTSLAAPRVAALASLLTAAASRPVTQGGIGRPPTAADIRARILWTADDLVSPDGRVRYARFGRVDFDRALAFNSTIVLYRDPNADCDYCGRSDFTQQGGVLNFTYGIDPAAPGTSDRIPWSNIVRLQALQPDDDLGTAFELRWIQPAASGVPATLRREQVTISTNEHALFASSRRKWRFRVVDIKEFTACAFKAGCPSASSP